MGIFGRRMNTASGATAVQIVSKERGVRTNLEHVGPAHSKADHDDGADDSDTDS